MALRTLTDLELRIIDFGAEAGTVNVTDTRFSDRLAAEFGWRPVAFYQRLNALLNDPAAERERPMEVRRLRRIRDDRRAARVAPVSTLAG
jgi:hypothetical protein